MAKRDPERTEKLRIAVRYLLQRDGMTQGSQSRLAEHFNVSRQRVHQIVVEERRHLLRTDTGGSNPALSHAS
jgi:DNA-directed RNA polymerase sigma subunit (sigma70/sigma32)